MSGGGRQYGVMDTAKLYYSHKQLATAVVSGLCLYQQFDLEALKGWSIVNARSQVGGRLPPSRNGAKWSYWPCLLLNAWK